MWLFPDRRPAITHSSRTRLRGSGRSPATCSNNSRSSSVPRPSAKAAFITTSHVFHGPMSPMAAPSSRSSHSARSSCGISILPMSVMVKTGRAHNEQMISGLAPIADMNEPCRQVAFVPLTDMNDVGHSLNRSAKKPSTELGMGGNRRLMQAHRAAPSPPSDRRVSKPSVNQPYTGASSSRASVRRPCSPHSRARLVAARNS